MLQLQEAHHKVRLSALQSPALHGVQAGSLAAAEGEGAGVKGFVWAVTALMSVRVIFGFFRIADAKYPRVDETQYRSTDVAIVLFRLAAIVWALWLLGLWSRP